MRSEIIIDKNQDRNGKKWIKQKRSSDKEIWLKSTKLSLVEQVMKEKSINGW